MGYLIGAGPIDPAVKRYNGGTSSFTMDNSGTTNGTLLWVDGVAQVPGTDYNVSGTTITTTTAAGAGTNNVTSLQLFNTGLITTPADNTVAIAKIQDDAVTLAKMAAGTDGNIISYDTSGNPVAVATGSDGQVLTSSGAGAVCAFETLSAGKVGQVVTALSAATTTNSTAIPGDDTIPQNTEGDEILTLAITPANSSSKLVIFVTIAAWYNSTSAQTKVAALFKDSDASAIYSITDATNDDYTKCLSFHWTQTSGSTSSQTFKLRVGSASGNVVVNYAGIYGGANQVVMSIWEVLP